MRYYLIDWGLQAPHACRSKIGSADSLGSDNGKPTERVACLLVSESLLGLKRGQRCSGTEATQMVPNEDAVMLG